MRAEAAGDVGRATGSRRCSGGPSARSDSSRKSKRPEPEAAGRRGTRPGRRRSRVGAASSGRDAPTPAGVRGARTRGRSWPWSGSWSCITPWRPGACSGRTRRSTRSSHLPAGVTYWQKGTFRLYHHNPPLVKLVAALPVVWPGRRPSRCIGTKSWTVAGPVAGDIRPSFACVQRRPLLRALPARPADDAAVLRRRRAGRLRLVAPALRELGGLLSLALWVFCPNILAHAAADHVGHGLDRAGRRGDLCVLALSPEADLASGRRRGHHAGPRAVDQVQHAAALCGLAVPLARAADARRTVHRGRDRARGTLRSSRGAWSTASRSSRLSILTIDAGYFFEGVGIPLGQYEFGSRTLTRPVPPGMARPHSKNPLLEATWQFRVNRFRETWLGRLPAVARALCPGLRRAEDRDRGDPAPLLRGHRRPDAAVIDEVAAARRSPTATRRQATPSTRRRAATDRLVVLTTCSPCSTRSPKGHGSWSSSRWSSLVVVEAVAAGWFDEIALWTVPVVVLVLDELPDRHQSRPALRPGDLPYVFISTGKVVPWCLGLRRARGGAIAGSIIAGSLGLTIAASAWIHPHYLAYFNWASGGPDRDAAAVDRQQPRLGPGPGRAAEVVAGEHPRPADRPGVLRADQPVDLRDAGRAVPLVPAAGAARDRRSRCPARRVPADRPGPQADAGLLRGQRDLALRAAVAALRPGSACSPCPRPIQPTWNLPSTERAWPSTSAQFRPIMPPIGHSIYVYQLSEEDVARVNPLLEGSAAAMRGRPITPACDRHRPARGRRRASVRRRPRPRSPPAATARADRRRTR